MGVRLLAALAVVVSWAWPAPPAGAATVVTGGAVATGSGTMSAGFTVTPFHQSYAFAARFTGARSVTAVTPSFVSGTVASDRACYFQGHSTMAETAVQGRGTFVGSCPSDDGTNVFTGIAGPMPVAGFVDVDTICELAYERVGTAMALTGTCTDVIDLGAAGSVSFPYCTTGTLVLQPTTLPPAWTVSYILAGALAHAPAPPKPLCPG